MADLPSGEARGLQDTLPGAPIPEVSQDEDGHATGAQKNYPATAADSTPWAATQEGSHPEPDQGALLQSKQAERPDSALKVTDGSGDQKGHSMVIPPGFEPLYSAKPLITLLAASLVLWVFGWLYIGAFWNPLRYLPNLQIAIVNCDAGLTAAQQAALPPAYQPYFEAPVGASLLSQAVWTPGAAAYGRLGWTNYTCPGSEGQAGCGPNEAACITGLIHSLRVRSEYFAAVYLPGNFTQILLTAYKPLNQTLQQLQMTYYYPQGRSYSTYSYISSVLTTLGVGLSTRLGLFVASLPASTAASFSTQFYIQPLQLVQVNVLPVLHFGQTFASYLLCVLNWLGAMFVASILRRHCSPAEVEGMAGKHPPLQKLLTAYFAKGLIGVLYTFIQSVLLIAIILILPNAQWHYSAGYAIAFMWFMSWSFVAFNAFLIRIFGLDTFGIFSAFLLILQLTSCGGVLHELLSNSFFKIGHIFPFYYGTRGLRAIFFGALLDEMYINWLVLLAWNAGLGLINFVAYAYELKRTPQHHHSSHAAGLKSTMQQVSISIAAAAG